MSIRRVLVFWVTVFVAGAGAPAMLAQQTPANNREQGRRNEQQQADVTALVQLVDQVSAADRAGSPDDQHQGEVEVNWASNHFLRGQDGSTYVPFTLSVDRADLTSPNAALYIRAVSTAPADTAPTPAEAPANQQSQNNRGRNDRNQAPPRVAYPWDNAYFASIPADGRVQRAMQLAGGEYDVFIAVKDQSTGQRNQMPKAGLLRKRLVVPDFKAPELATSSVMIGNIEPLPAPLSANEQQENPYVFGSMRIVPLSDPKLSKASELSLIFWIYGAQSDPATMKPNVTIEYNFHQKEGTTEKYFNKTAPQDLNAQTLPPEFDLAAGHQLPGSLGVPLASFPEGDFRLEIKVTDKVSGKSITQNVNFSVTAA